MNEATTNRQDLQRTIIAALAGALSGTAVGIILAMATLSAHLAVLTDPPPLDARTTAIAAGLAFVLALGFGLATARLTSRDATRIPAFGGFLIASATLVLVYFGFQLAAIALIVALTAGPIAGFMIERRMRTR